MPIELSDVHIFNEDKARIYRVNENGFSPEDMLLLEMHAQDIIAGRVDVISVALAEGVSYTQEINDRILAQLDEVFRQYCAKEPFTLGNSGLNYNGLHVDAERSPDDYRKYLTDVELRIHCNSGQHQLVNCPADRNPRDFEPFIIFGRSGNLFI